MSGEAKKRTRPQLRGYLRGTPGERIIRDLTSKDSWDVGDVVCWGAVTNRCAAEVAASDDVANRLYVRARNLMKKAVADGRMARVEDPSGKNGWIVGRESGMELAGEMEAAFRVLRASSIEALAEKISGTLAVDQETDEGDGGPSWAAYDPATLDRLVDRYVRQFGLESEPGRHRFLDYRALRNDLAQLRIFQEMVAEDTYTTETLEDLAALLRRFLEPKNYLVKIEAPGEGEVPTEHMILAVQDCFLE